MLSIAGLVLFLTSVYAVNRIREARNYRPFPKTAEERLRALQNARKTDYDDDEITEIINTMDYHQIPKQLIAEKAKRLAEGHA